MTRPRTQGGCAASMAQACCALQRCSVAALRGLLFRRLRGQPSICHAICTDSLATSCLDHHNPTNGPLRAGVVSSTVLILYLFRICRWPHACNAILAKERAAPENSRKLIVRHCPRPGRCEAICISESGFRVRERCQVEWLCRKCFSQTGRILDSSSRC